MKTAIALVLALFVFVPAAYAGVCPSGASDCFLCGGVGGIPCDKGGTSCTGPYRPGLGNVACECPQGEPCVCYCPYGGGNATATGSESLLAGAAECTDATGCPNCAIISSASGTVAVYRNGKWCLAKSGTVIGAGDKVWSPGDSTAKIKYFDGGTADMGNDAAFTFQSLSVTKPGGTYRMVQSGVYGAYHYMISTDRIEQFEVRTGSVVIGVNGTEFLVEAGNSSTKVKVLDGKVTLGGTKSTKTVVLGKGEYASVSASGGAPSAPATFDASSEKRWWGGGSLCCGAAFILALILAGGLFVRR